MSVNPAFTNRTTNGASSGYALSGSTAVVEVQKDSLMGDAYVVIQACSADTDAKYSSVEGEGSDGVMRSPGTRIVTLAAGYYVRLVVGGVSSANPTSINATITT